MAEAEKVEEKKNSDKVELSPPKEELVETKHMVIIDGQEIGYTVHAGTLLLKDEADNNKPKATIFFIAYLRDNLFDKSQRPITFSFNGGPGSSSVWLHLGLLGPKRVLMDEIGNPLPPPAKLVENPYSLLDQTDLVFIDPVSTGYSRAVVGEKAEQFHNYDKDVESVGEFIRLFTTRYQRWDSPKFLIGESYGTTRAAALAGHLQQRHGIYLNGIMLVSTILNFQTARFTVGNDLPYILFLPTYVATAWYHHCLKGKWQRNLHRTLQVAQQFATTDYTLALMKGSNLSKLERTRIVDMLSQLTGLSSNYIEQSNLRLNIHRFVKELLRAQRRTVGRLDSRFTGIDRDAVGEQNEYDPSYATIQGPYTAALNHYVRAELKFESDLPYEILTDKVWPWKFEKQQNEFLNVGETLRQAMHQNQYLKVYVANGYYDLATPYMATEYTFSHLDLDASLRSNVTMSYYEAGHMMYIHQPSLAKQKADLSRFVAGAWGQ